MSGCQQCGAALEVPLDLAATTVRCHYCGQTTSLPADVMNARRQERMARMAATTPHVQPRRVSTAWIGWMVGGVVLSTLVVGVIAVLGTAATVTTTPITVTPPAEPTPTAAPKPIASDAKSTGATRATEL